MARVSVTPTAAVATGWLIVVLWFCLLGPHAVAAKQMLWPGDKPDSKWYSWPAFVPGHELDYFIDTEWMYMNYKAGCPFTIHHSGVITLNHIRKYCDGKYRYRVIEITRYYIVLLIDNVDKDHLKRKAKHPALVWGTFIWSLHRGSGDNAYISECRMILDQHDPGHTNRPEFIGPEGFDMSQEELLRRWTQNTYCNPKNLPPDRDYFWPNGPDMLYTINPERANPLWGVASGEVEE